MGADEPLKIKDHKSQFHRSGFNYLDKIFFRSR